MNTTTLPAGLAWADAHLRAALAGAALLAVLLTATAWGSRRLIRRYGTDVFRTGLGGLMGNALSAYGMWSTLRDGIGLPTVVLATVFPLFEVAVFASALRAGKTIRAAAAQAAKDGETVDPSGGVDGIAVWVLTGTSAALSAVDAHNLPDAAARITAPVVAAWLWERSLAPARRPARGHTTPGILATYLGRLRANLLSWAGEATATEIARGRAITRAAHLSDQLRTSRNRTGLRGRWTSRRLRRAVGTSGAAHYPDQRQRLLAEIAASRHADTLAGLTPPSPWGPGTPPSPRRLVSAASTSRTNHPVHLTLPEQTSRSTPSRLTSDAGGPPPSEAGGRSRDGEDSQLRMREASGRPPTSRTPTETRRAAQIYAQSPAATAEREAIRQALREALDTGREVSPSRWARHRNAHHGTHHTAEYIRTQLRWVRTQMTTVT